MVTVTRSLPANPFADSYIGAVGALPGATEAWIDGLRQSARAAMGASGLPSRKVEAWKYTDLRDLAAVPFIPAAKADDIDVDRVPVTVPQIEGAVRLVLVNGQFRQDLSDDLTSLGEGVRAQSLKDVFRSAPALLKERLGGLAGIGADPVAALNTSFVDDGVFVTTEEGAQADKVLHLISIGASGAESVAFHPRILIAAASGSRVSVVESHVGLPGQPYLSNPVSEIYVAADATVEHYVAVRDDSEAFHLGKLAVDVAERGRYVAFTLILGAAKARREATAMLAGREAVAQMNAAYGVSARHHSDLTTVVDHSVPDTRSEQTIKGVLAGHGHGVFQGRIHVARGAQKTDGQMLHKALLLDRNAEVDCKPELEIYADDVQCSHGAAIGELDADQLFYLMARGIDPSAARSLLIEGFLEDVVVKIPRPAVRDAFASDVRAWLANLTAQETAL